MLFILLFSSIAFFNSCSNNWKKETKFKLPVTGEWEMLNENSTPNVLRMSKTNILLNLFTLKFKTKNSKITADYGIGSQNNFSEWLHMYNIALVKSGKWGTFSSCFGRFSSEYKFASTELRGKISLTNHLDLCGRVFKSVDYTSSCGITLFNNGFDRVEGGSLDTGAHFIQEGKIGQYDFKQKLSLQIKTFCVGEVGRECTDHKTKVTTIERYFPSNNFYFEFLHEQLMTKIEGSEIKSLIGGSIECKELPSSGLSDKVSAQVCLGMRLNKIVNCNLTLLGGYDLRPNESPVLLFDFLIDR